MPAHDAEKPGGTSPAVGTVKVLETAVIPEPGVTAYPAQFRLSAVSPLTAIRWLTPAWPVAAAPAAAAPNVPRAPNSGSVIMVRTAGRSIRRGDMVTLRG